MMASGAAETFLIEVAEVFGLLEMGWAERFCFSDAEESG